MQEQNDLRNLVTALLLSSLILLAWQYFYVSPMEEEAEALRAKQSTEQTALAVNAPTAGSVENAATPTLAQPREQALAASTRITIASPALKGSISTKGVRIDDLTLTNYREELPEDSPKVVLLSPSGTEKSYFAESGWISPDSTIKLPSKNTVWSASSETLTPESPVTFRWDNGEGLTFERTVALDENYLFTITQKVINTSAAPIRVAPYGFLNKQHTAEGTPFAILHEGPIGVPDGTLHEFTYSDLKDDAAKESFQNASGWMGISDKYWLTAFVPGNAKFTANVQYYAKGGQDRYQTDFLGQTLTVEAGSSTQVTSHLFAGAKKLALLEKYGKELNVPLFDRAVDFGMLYFLTKPLFIAMNFFYKLLGNFGLAILLLTVVIKLILYPFASKSFASMAAMKQLMPQIQELKDKHGDDRMKVNQEMMALYKREGVNPAGGCLPMLIQIPVFFALYKVLFVTIEMRHAPFYGWIKDLSMPDPSNFFTLFGLLPWDPPSLMHIGILPLAMAISMVLQQKLNPKPTDATQAMIMKWMPWAFLFMFAGFPAGLVLYWLWSNILSILQQWVITRRHNKKHEAKA